MLLKQVSAVPVAAVEAEVFRCDVSKHRNACVFIKNAGANTLTSCKIRRMPTGAAGEPVDDVDTATFAGLTAGETKHLLVTSDCDTLRIDAGSASGTTIDVYVTAIA